VPAPALELSSFISIGLDMTASRSLAEGGWTIVGGGEVGVVVDALEVILSSVFTVGGVVGRGGKRE
jgi:hypothetical protein